MTDWSAVQALIDGYQRRKGAGGRFVTTGVLIFEQLMDRADWEDWMFETAALASLLDREILAELCQELGLLREETL